jgi:hypothetical protein
MAVGGHRHDGAGACSGAGVGGSGVGSTPHVHNSQQQTARPHDGGDVSTVAAHVTDAAGHTSDHVSIRMAKRRHII